MKKLITLLSATFFAIIIFAQAPEKMSYQAVIRDANDSIISNRNIRIRASVIEGSALGNSVYVETHSATTNSNGLISIQIGNGSVVSGNFSAINWADTSYFIKTETDPNGGTNYTISGTAQFLSVPYALYANSSSVKTDATINGDGTDSKPLSVDLTNIKTYWFENSSQTGINYNANVGVNTDNPQASLHVTSSNIGSNNTAYHANVSNGDVNVGYYARIEGGSQSNYGNIMFMPSSNGSNINAGNYIDIQGNSSTGEYYGSRIFTRGNTTNFNMGIYAEAFEGNNSPFNAGVDGSTRTTGPFNVGVGGYATGAAISDANRTNYGLYGFAVDASNNYGVFGEAKSSGASVLNNYGVYGEAANAINDNYAGYFKGNVVIDGNVSITGNISKGSGTFKIDHPLDPDNKFLVHSFVESPEMMNVYNGNITTDANGYAVVELPDYFEATNKDFRYQLTVIGTFAQAIVAEEVSGNNFKVQTSVPNVKVSWQVTGIRNDPYANKNRINPVQDKPENQKRKYLHNDIYQGAPIYGSKTSEHQNEVNTQGNRL